MKKILLFLILATPVMGMSIKEAEKILEEPSVGGWRVEAQAQDLIMLTSKAIDPFTPFLKLICLLNKKDEENLEILFCLEDPHNVIKTVNNVGYIRIFMPGAKQKEDDQFRNTYLISLSPGIYNLNYILQSGKKSDPIIRPFGNLLLKESLIFAISPVPGQPKGKHLFESGDPKYIYAAAVVLMKGISKDRFHKSLKTTDFSETEFKLVPYK